MYVPKYRITNTILKYIGAIEAAKDVIENAPLVPSYTKEFQSDAIVRTIYHGTHIEGNDLTLMQTKKVLEGEDVYGRARDIQEVINYRNATQLVEELAYRRGGYSPDMLTEIQKLTVYKIVPEEKIGVFRTTQVVIKEEGSGKIILEPPPFAEVPYLIEDFFAWLNSPEAGDVHPILKAGIAHYILVAVHPFIEGNGRTVRAFTNLLLMKEGYDIKRFFSLEEHFDANLASYYAAFGEVDKQSKIIGLRDMTPWLEYFTQVVAIELTKIKEKIRKISIDMRFKTRVGQQVPLTERQMSLIEYISDQGSVSMQELKQLLPMISEDTVLRDLQDMQTKGIIKKEGSTKASRYIIANR
ncbi:MAG: Fic family protein [Candidatus Microgenomates bacterium]|jgi:Fic family protein